MLNDWIQHGGSLPGPDIVTIDRTVACIVDYVDGCALPFLVGGPVGLANFANERDLGLPFIPLIAPFHYNITRWLLISLHTYSEPDKVKRVVYEFVAN